MLTIEYIGLACFRLWGETGEVVVVDPYTPDDIGMPEITIEGDVILASSLTDTAHFNPGLVAGSPRIVNALDVAAGAEHTVGERPVVAVPVTEDPTRIDAPKDCAMYGLRVGGLDVVHMGDAGYVPSEAELSPFIGHCDVLLILAGILFTPPLEELDRIIDTLRPSWILPMHYFLPPMIYAFRPVDDFLRHRSNDPVLAPRTPRISLPLDAPWSSERPVLVVPKPAGIGS